VTQASPVQGRPRLGDGGGLAEGAGFESAENVEFTTICDDSRMKNDTPTS